jgi:hypothetical protein
VASLLERAGVACPSGCRGHGEATALEAKARHFARELLGAFLTTFRDVRHQYAGRPRERIELKEAIARQLVKVFDPDS